MANNMEGFERYPIGVEGLTKILFPSGISGFEKPSVGKPRTVLITGAPGAGKTTLATQMFIEMAKKDVKCSFITTRDDKKTIGTIALTFGFCTNEEWEKLSVNPSIEIHKVTPDEYITEPPDKANILANAIRGGKKIKPDVLFIDSLNITYLNPEKKMKRKQIKEIFKSIDINVNPDMLTILLLEDYKEYATEETRELIEDCEFLADIVIDLTTDKGDRYIEVKKKHYGPHVGGKHYFDICQKHHHLSNIETNAPSGIIVYPSISRFLKESRIDTYSIGKVHTGITHLDSILTYSPDEPDDIITGDSIEKNACVVISGERGNHKLSFGLNILIGGLWERVKDKSGKVIRVESSDKDVLLISLDEPTNLPMDKTALAYNTHNETKRKSIFEEKGLDNGAWIEWRIHTKPEHNKHPRDPEKEQEKRPEKKDKESHCIFDKIISDEQTGRNDHKSIFLNRWCAYTGEFEGKKEDIKGCSSLIVASYRPGHITPDEFLYSISRLIEFEDQYEEVEIRDNIFEIRLPSIRGDVSVKIFKQLEKKGILVEKNMISIENGGDKTTYCLKTGFRPEEAWEALNDYKDVREAIIPVLNDYKRKKTRFSRVLFHSTAFLQSRFPLLYKESLFSTALANYFKSKDIMSIFINNTDIGYDTKISHGVLSSADYIIELKKLEKYKGSEHSWSRLNISNIKAKSYVQTPHCVSVQQKNGRNELIVENEVIADNPSASKEASSESVSTAKKSPATSSPSPR